MANRSESIAGAKMEASSFFVGVCAINFPKSPAGICFATAAHSSLEFFTMEFEGREIAFDVNLI